MLKVDSRTIIYQFMKSHSPDYVFITIAAVLLVFGLASLISASSVISFKDYGDSYFVAKKQLTHGILPGVLLFFLLYRVNYENIKKIAPILMGISLFLLILVLIPGIGLSHGEARSWVSFLGISFQPAELAKLALILYLALLFSNRKKEDIQDFNKGFLTFIFLLGGVLLLILLQPDLGTAIVVVSTALSLYVLAGARKTHLALILAGGLLLFFVFMRIAPDYQKNRLISFLNPQYDTQGIGYHINQAFYAIGSGGFWGLGFGESKQKFLYLPEVKGDSIFAIIAEELGFLTCFIFIGLITFLVYRGFQIAKNSPDSFTLLAVSGIVFWFAIQSIINIGAMVGLLPLTGVTLPLVSSGGSSMLVFMGAFGIIAGISRHTKGRV